MLGKVFADDAEFESPVSGRIIRGDAQEVAIVRILIGRRHFRHLDPVLPFYFERRRRQAQRTGKTAGRCDAGFRDRFFAGEDGHALGQLCRRHVIPIDLVGSAGDRGAQPLDWKARNAADAGHAAGQFRPIVRLADAERRDHADASDGNDGTARFVPHCRGRRACA